MEKIEIGVYWFENEETGDKVLDIDSMKEEFEEHIKKLEVKLNG